MAADDSTPTSSGPYAGVFCREDGTEPGLQEGWSRATDPGAKMMIHAPPGWYDSNSSSVLIALNRADPSVRSLSGSLSSQGINLFDSSPEATSGLALSEIQVIAHRNDGKDLAFNISKFEHDAPKSLLVEVIDHPMGKVAHFVQDQPGRDFKNRDVAMRIHNYLFITPSIAYQLVAKYPVDLESQELPDIQQAVDSFRIGEMAPGTMPEAPIMPVSRDERVGILGMPDHPVRREDFKQPWMPGQNTAEDVAARVNPTIPTASQEQTAPPTDQGAPSDQPSQADQGSASSTGQGADNASGGQTTGESGYQS